MDEGGGRVLCGNYVESVEGLKRLHLKERLKPLFQIILVNIAANASSHVSRWLAISLIQNIHTTKGIHAHTQTHTHTHDIFAI